MFSFPWRCLSPTCPHNLIIRAHKYYLQILYRHVGGLYRRIKMRKSNRRKAPQPTGRFDADDMAKAIEASLSHQTMPGSHDDFDMTLATATELRRALAPVDPLYACCAENSDALEPTALLLPCSYNRAQRCPADDFASGKTMCRKHRTARSQQARVARQARAAKKATEQELEDQAQEASRSPAEHAEYEAAILDLARCTIVSDLASYRCRWRARCGNLRIWTVPIGGPRGPQR